MATGSGKSVRESASTSSLTQSAPGCPALEQLAAQPAVRKASSAEKQPAVLGRIVYCPRIEVVQQVAPLAVEQPLAPHGDRHHLGTAGLQAVAHQLQRRILARPDEQPAPDRVRADREGFERLARDRPAADQVTTSSTSPAAISVSACRERTTSSLLTSTATCSGFEPEVSDQLPRPKALPAAASVHHSP